MKILLVSAHNFFYPGGVRAHIVNLAENLRYLGHEVTILAPKIKKGQKNKFNSNISGLVEVGKTTLIRGNGSRFDIIFDSKTEVEKLFSENNFDVVHLHNFAYFLSRNVTKVANRFNIPIIFTNHSLPKRFSKLAINSKTVKLVLNKCRHIIFVAKNQEYLAKDTNVKCSIIPNGVSVRNDFLPKNLDLKKEIRIMFIGRNETKKGLKYLVKAFSKLVNNNPNLDLFLDVVGGGNEKLLQKNSIDKEIYNRILFHGFKTYSEILEIGKSANFLVAPSIGFESFGIILLEGMSMGLATIGFANSGFKDVMTEDMAYGLVKNKDINALVAKLQELLDNPIIYENFSKAGLAHVKKYDWEKVAKEIEKIYLENLN